MSDKLIVQLWGMSLSADGATAIGAAVAIFTIFALLIAWRRRA
jgi:hypothetical protein